MWWQERTNSHKLFSDLHRELWLVCAYTKTNKGESKTPKTLEFWNCFNMGMPGERASVEWSLPVLSALQIRYLAETWAQLLLSRGFRTARDPTVSKISRGSGGEIYRLNE